MEEAKTPGRSPLAVGRQEAIGDYVERAEPLCCPRHALHRFSSGLSVLDIIIEAGAYDFCRGIDTGMQLRAIGPVPGPGSIKW